MCPCTAARQTSRVTIRSIAQWFNVVALVYSILALNDCPIDFNCMIYKVVLLDERKLTFYFIGNSRRKASLACSSNLPQYIVGIVAVLLLVQSVAP